ncbi:hypothetical protein HY490_00055 [Candidatus Woesearchaeota archaeon]|nr:hypothetical protein [Candidatus Woesearchaeota archaeon]
MNAIATVPPYAPFVKEVARHPVVSGIRLNTVMPVKEPLEDVLKRLQDFAGEKTVWIDLKGRQLRTTSYATPPFTEVTISHAIDVKTPVMAYFGNGREAATLAGVNGNKLFFLDGPRRVVGPGESINIPDAGLVIHGGLTDGDKAYIEAARQVGNHHYMLSFVESKQDIDDLKKLDDNAIVVAKIESRKGLEYVREKFDNTSRLMAARGDLYIEIKRPHHILEAVETIVAKDPDAIAASRILSSLAISPEPLCEDISDVAYLTKTGYKTLMLGDEVCLRRESVIGALNLLEAIAER